MRSDSAGSVIAIFIGFSVLFGGVAHASHWASDTLSNDAAADLISEVEHQTGIGLVHGTLEGALSNASPLDDDQASRVLAAAELVAPMLGRPSPTLENRARDWALEQSKASSGDFANLTRLALAAIDRVSNASETLEMMQDSSTGREWNASLTDLRKRLTAS